MPSVRAARWGNIVPFDSRIFLQGECVDEIDGQVTDSTLDRNCLT